MAMIYLNDKLVPESKAVVSVFDHGFLYGDGIYETLRAYEGAVFKLEEHLDRLFHSASLINLRLLKSPEEIEKALYETLRANRLKEAYVRITFSRGAGPIGLDPSLCPKPTFVIIANPFKGYPTSYYKKGVKAAVVKTRRNYKGAIDPQIKSLNFLNNVLAKAEAMERGAYEAVMLNYKGHVAEGTVSNIFFVKDGVICTPSVNAGILDGITRRTIINIAKAAGLTVKEGSFRPDDIYKADEVFLSNTTMEVMPVNQFDDVKFRISAAGVTKAIHKAYKAEVREYLRRRKRPRA
ncbi:MAG: branched-chain-amino-acid transaminase [Nitrospirae bacterium]|nr:branched-chain-amino-acid transaminase [Nitrospirota bacterium]